VAGGYARSRTRFKLGARAPAAVLVLALLLLSGGFELHSSAGEHSMGPSVEPISIDARHARQAAHLETSELELRTVCPACLLHHSAGLPLAALALVAGRPAGRRLTTRRPAPALASLRTRGNPRAPPFS